MFGQKQQHKLEKAKSFSEREEYNTELLEKILEIGEENNDILIGLQKSEKRATNFRLIYWAFVLSAFFGLFYYLKPIIDFLFQNFTNFKSLLYQIPTLGERLPETNNIQNILNQFK